MDGKLVPNSYADRGVIYTYFFKKELDCQVRGIKSYLTKHDRSSPLQTLSTFVSGLVQGVVIKNLRGILTKSDKLYIQSIIVTVGPPSPPWPNDKTKRTT